VNDNVLIKNVEDFYIKNGFDYIFLITDNHSSLNNFKNHFQDKLTYNNFFRSSNFQAIHFQTNLNYEKIKLAEEVLIDSYCLSLTDYKFICNSNVSTFSLLCNYNENNFLYVDK